MSNCIYPVFYIYLPHIYTMSIHIYLPTYTVSIHIYLPIYAVSIHIYLPANTLSIHSYIPPSCTYYVYSYIPPYTYCVYSYIPLHILCLLYTFLLSPPVYIPPISSPSPVHFTIPQTQHCHQYQLRSQQVRQCVSTGSVGDVVGECRHQWLLNKYQKTPISLVNLILSFPCSFSLNCFLFQKQQVPTDAAKDIHADGADTSRHEPLART